MRTTSRRALEDHLKNVPLFASLTPEFIDSLRDRVELVRFGKGDVICRQGDVADSFYLIRIGFVKVSEDHPQGELVLNYLGRGGYFGEIGLLGMGAGGGGRRTATCSALDHVEVVRIGAEDFQRMVDGFPDIRSSLETSRREASGTESPAPEAIDRYSARPIPGARG